MILTDEEIRQIELQLRQYKRQPLSLPEFAAAIESAVLRKLRERPAEAWRLLDEDASKEYRRQVYVYYGREDFVAGTNVENVFPVLERLHIIPGEEP